jgi:hypothetical protein
MISELRPHGGRNCFILKIRGDSRQRLCNLLCLVHGVLFIHLLIVSATFCQNCFQLFAFLWAKVQKMFGLNPENGHIQLWQILFASNQVGWFALVVEE